MPARDRRHRAAQPALTAGYAGAPARRGPARLSTTEIMTCLAVVLPCVAGAATVAAGYP